jgi:hypothetical protein
MKFADPEVETPDDGCCIYFCSNTVGSLSVSPFFFVSRFGFLVGAARPWLELSFGLHHPHLLARPEVFCRASGGLLAVSESVLRSVVLAIQYSLSPKAKPRPSASYPSTASTP